LHQFSGQPGEPVKPAVSESSFDDEILTFDISQFVEAHDDNIEAAKPSGAKDPQAVDPARMLGVRTEWCGQNQQGHRGGESLNRETHDHRIPESPTTTEEILLVALIDLDSKPVCPTSR
jgi:hypothetical protein